MNESGRTHADLGRIVAGIHERCTRSPLQSSLAVGRYLLVELFSDRHHLADANHPGWGTFRALTRRTDLPVRPMWLKEALYVSAVFELLPETTRYALTLTHLRVLLIIDDAVRRAELAMESVEQGWGAKELANHVHAVGRRPSARGRPRKSPVARILRELLQGTDALAKLAASGEHVPAREVDAIRKKLRGL